MSVTLVIESGTAASASANSYITVAELTQFCENHGLTIPAATLASTTKMSQAILRGMAFVEAEYSFKGYKSSYDNPLEWPRYGVYDEEGIDPSLELPYYQEIPKGLKNAVCRAAYEEAAVPGTLQSKLTAGVRRKKIDVIETEFFGTSPSKPVWRTIEGFLKGLIEEGGTVTLKRT